MQAIGALLLLAEDAAPGTVLDRDFVERHTVGFEELGARTSRELDWDAVLGRDRADPRADRGRGARCSPPRSATVHCWAMGITQHRNAVATIKEFVNVALAAGHIGKPGAGLCPVRGHSNVQGDRTMGIWEKPPALFLDALGAEFGFEPPREHGFDAVDADPGVARRRAKVFVGAGRQLRRRRCPTRTSPRRRCAAPR